MEVINPPKSTNNDIPPNVEKYIENKIENKINNLLETLPDNKIDKKESKNPYNLTINELYKNTLQTVIDIINDIIELNNKVSQEQNDINYYITNVIYILTDNDRRLYVGIILIILSFIIYFIDGVSV
tara:strand:+ start:1750 stop:2130 length:381 start_codon:yes stop_codon:yes gene_type:complete